MDWYISTLLAPWRRTRRNIGTVKCSHVSLTHLGSILHIGEFYMLLEIRKEKDELGLIKQFPIMIYASFKMIVCMMYLNIDKKLQFSFNRVF